MNLDSYTKMILSIVVSILVCVSSSEILEYLDPGETQTSEEVFNSATLRNSPDENLSNKTTICCSIYIGYFLQYTLISLNF